MILIIIVVEETNVMLSKIDIIHTKNKHIRIIKLRIDKTKTVRWDVLQVVVYQ